MTSTFTGQHYTGGRRMLDADSHLMEMPGFLDAFMPSDMIDRLKGREMTRLVPMLDKAAADSTRRQTDAAARTAAEERLLVDKGWNAMGAFDPAERSHVVDMFGFDGQLVFATFAAAMFMGKDLDLLYAGSSAHNFAVADFCKDDARLLPVGFIPLDDPDRAVALLVEAIDAGCAAIHVPSTAAGDRSPTHPDLDPFWSTLNDSGVPFVLHVGGGGRLLDRAFHNNGRPVTDHLGGGENIRSKDFLAISNSPSLFLGVLILDGLFDRFPNLRGGVIEEGASWVVSWMHQLDFAQRAFRRTEAPLTTLAMKPSEYVHQHLKFTPFPGEPVGWMIEQAGDDLFMFSTDFPHPEGGKDPLAKFEDAMPNTSEESRQRFYYDNMAELLGPALVPAVAAGLTMSITAESITAESITTESVTSDPVAAGFDATRLGRIDDHFRSTYVDTGKIAGCQVVVGRRGHVAHRATIGSLDLETGEGLHDQTIWRWYSMTKPVTAVALLSLVEQARVKLSDPIHRFLPEWRDVKVSERNSDGTFDLVDLDRPISVKHAMMHMTGIGPGPKGARLDMQSLMGGSSSTARREATNLGELSRLLATEPLRFQPGSRWFYSWSSDICARLVEVIADEPFGSYLQRTIFDPLGMTDTGFHAAEGEGHRVPSLYARGPGNEVRLLDDRAAGRLCRVPTMQSGGGGLVGPIDDYARFCQMLTAGGTLGDARVLGRPTVELMRTNHLPGNSPAGGQLRDFAVPGGYGEVGFDGNGFGLQVAVGLGPAATSGVGPAGDFMWGGAASTVFWVDPTEDLYAIFMTQIMPSGVYDFRGQLRSLVYAAIDD